jgi:hypothetical protein
MVCYTCFHNGVSWKKRLIQTTKILCLEAVINHHNSVWDRNISCILPILLNRILKGCIIKGWDFIKLTSYWLFKDLFFFCSFFTCLLGRHEPLHQPFFVLGIFKIGSCKLFAQGWVWTLIVLISGSWVARITGMSHWLPASKTFLMKLAFLFFFSL